MLRSGTDLGDLFQYLEALTLGVGSAKLTFANLRTNESTDEWERRDDGTWSVWVSGPVWVAPEVECASAHPVAVRHESRHPDRDTHAVWVRVCSRAERQRLVDAVGSQCKAVLRFRANGDSPALVAGEDIEWLRPCLLSIDSAELIEDDGG